MTIRPGTTFLLALSLLLAGCESRRLVGPEEMYGEWLVTHPAGNGARTETRMTFEPDGSFQSGTRWYGFYGHSPTTLTGYSRSDGRYRTEGNRLMLRIQRSEEWQMYAVGPNPSITVIGRPEWAKQGTIRVEDDLLYHTYVSAPADAPVTSTQVYSRVR